VSVTPGGNLFCPLPRIAPRGVSGRCVVPCRPFPAGDTRKTLRNKVRKAVAYRPFPAGIAGSFLSMPLSARVGMIGGSKTIPPMFPLAFPASRVPGFFGVSASSSPSRRSDRRQLRRVRHGRRRGGLPLARAGDTQGVTSGNTRRRRRPCFTPRARGSVTGRLPSMSGCLIRRLRSTAQNLRPMGHYQSLIVALA